MTRHAAWLVLAVLALPALGQEEAYCYLTKVEVTPLSNAVKIVLHGDGILRPRGDWRWYWEEYAKDRWRRVQRRRFPFLIRNARSKVGSYIDIGKYPVSHLELTVPPEAAQGIGLEVAVVLYRPGELRRSRMPGLYEGGSRESDKIQVDFELSRDERTMNIWVSSDRSPHAVAQEETESERELERLEVQARDGAVQVRAVNVSLRELLEMIGRVTETPLVVGGDVQRCGSAVLPPLPLERLLALVGEAWGLSVVRRGDQGYVVRDTLAPQASGYELAATRCLPVYYSSATEAAGLLPNYLDPFLYADDDHSRLVVTASPQLTDRIERDLRVVDRPGPQIEVEAVVVEGRADDTWESELGLDFVDGETRGELDSAEGNLEVRVAPGLTPEFALRLRALETARRVRTRAAPKVTVLNRERAEVFVGQRQYFVALSGWRHQEVYLSSTDVGVRLEAYPWTGDGQVITVPYQAEAGSIVGRDENGLPLLTVRRARGTIRVNSGDTVIVGGLRLASDEVTHHRVPLLSELPLVGSLFGSRRRVAEDTEAVIFLTPRALAMTDVQTPPLPPPGG